MEIGFSGRLLRLGDEPPGGNQQDLRGRRVFDKGGEEIGVISGLLVDEAEGQIRLFEVTVREILPIGTQHVVLPVDAIDRLEPDRLFVDDLRERVLSSPPYNPNATPPPEFWDGLFKYFGYQPFWEAG